MEWFSDIWNYLAETYRLTVGFFTNNSPFFIKFFFLFLVIEILFHSLILIDVVLSYLIIGLKIIVSQIKGFLYSISNSMRFILKIKPKIYLYDDGKKIYKFILNSSGKLKLEGTVEKNISTNNLTGKDSLK